MLALTMSLDLSIQTKHIGGSSIIMPHIPYCPLTPTIQQHLGCLDSNDFSYIFQFLQKWSYIPFKTIYF